MLKAKKASHLKAPGKRFQSPVRSVGVKPPLPPPEPLLEEESEEEEQQADYHGKPLHFTSLRVLVWVNFGMVFVLASFFLIYVLTRPSVTGPVTVSEHKKYASPSSRISFTLVPHSESNGKWMRVTLSGTVDPAELIDVRACCLKEQTFSCIHDVTLLGSEATIRIRNSHMVGSACHLMLLSRT